MFKPPLFSREKEKKTSTHTHIHTHTPFPWSWYQGSEFELMVLWDECSTIWISSISSLIPSGFSVHWVVTCSTQICLAGGRRLLGSPRKARLRRSDNRRGDLGFGLLALVDLVVCCSVLEEGSLGDGFEGRSSCEVWWLLIGAGDGSRSVNVLHCFRILRYAARDLVIEMTDSVRA